VFAGKHGFITLRDLFRWAERRPNGYQQLAEEGYMLLAERLRKPEEKKVIKEVLEKNMKNVVIDEEEIYSRSFQADSSDLFESLRMAEGFGSMVWNQSMRRCAL
jgi:midasin (ATPase involved in ribosome maturation)